MELLKQRCNEIQIEIDTLKAKQKAIEDVIQQSVDCLKAVKEVYVQLNNIDSKIAESFTQEINDTISSNVKETTAKSPIEEKQVKVSDFKTNEAPKTSKTSSVSTNVKQSTSAIEDLQQDNSSQVQDNASSENSTIVKQTVQVVKKTKDPDPTQIAPGIEYIEEIDRGIIYFADLMLAKVWQNYIEGLGITEDFVLDSQGKEPKIHRLLLVGISKKDIKELAVTYNFTLAPISTESKIEVDSTAEAADLKTQNVPQTEVEELANPVNISPSSKAPFGSALTLDTEASYSKGTITMEYPVIINNNAYRSAQRAYLGLNRDLSQDQKFELMVNIQRHKLTQHPRFIEYIDKAGGEEWLSQCSYINGENLDEKFWQGVGVSSLFIKALIQAYKECALENKNKDPNEINLAPNVSFHNEENKMTVCFDDLTKAETWEKYIQDDLYLSDQFVLDKSGPKNFEHKLSVFDIDIDSAKYLAQNADFTILPSDRNPKDADA